MITFINESILSSDVIIHQCNSKGIFGAGIAKTLAFYFPEIVKKGEYGTYDIIKVHNDNVPFVKYVVNIYAQDNVGPCTIEGKDSFYLRSKNLYSSLEEIFEKFDDSLEIGIPLLGSGLAKDPTSKIKNDLLYFMERHFENVMNICKKTSTHINVYYL